MLHCISDADPAYQTYLEGEIIPTLHRNELSGRRTLDEGTTVSELGSSKLRCIQWTIIISHSSLFSLSLSFYWF